MQQLRPILRALVADGRWRRSLALAVAFTTIVTAAQERADSTRLVIGLLAVTIVTCWMTITFSFALTVLAPSKVMSTFSSNVSKDSTIRASSAASSRT